MLKTRSTADLLAEQIREAIGAGDLQPGEQLHQEQLAAKYGVSRSPLREALRLLEAEGLIVYHSNKGAAVADLDDESVREIFEIREALETALIRRAALAMDDETISRAERVLEQMERETDPRAWLDAHRRFHEALYSPARRPRMVELLHQHQMRVSRTPQAAAVVGNVKQSFAHNERQLLEALRARDADAAVSATIEHLHVSRDMFLKRTTHDAC